MVIFKLSNIENHGYAWNKLEAMDVTAVSEYNAFEQRLEIDLVISLVWWPKQFKQIRDAYAFVNWLYWNQIWYPFKTSIIDSN